MSGDNRPFEPLRTMNLTWPDKRLQPFHMNIVGDVERVQVETGFPSDIGQLVRNCRR